MNLDKFFKEAKPHSIVKMKIASKYFGIWAQIIKRTVGHDLTYLDLYSGPGRYEDGTPGTPLRILDQVNSISGLTSKMRMYFYENDRTLYDRLLKAINDHPVTSKMVGRIEIHNTEVGRSILPKLQLSSGTFCFIDPCGFKGVSMDLLSKVTKGWGCDCLFFLSTSGIRRNVDREDLRGDLIDLLGNQGLEQLKEVIRRGGQDRVYREEVLSILKSGLAANGMKYFIPFRVLAQNTSGTSHYFVFISKHHRGFEKMKETMEEFSSMDGDGFPLYYWPADPGSQLVLSEAKINLSKQLLKMFAPGRYLAKDLFERCHVAGVEYTNRCISKAVHYLELEGSLTVDKPAKARMRNGHPTLGEKRTVTFL